MSPSTSRSMGTRHTGQKFYRLPQSIIHSLCNLWKHWIRYRVWPFSKSHRQIEQVRSSYLTVGCLWKVIRGSSSKTPGGSGWSCSLFSCSLTNLMASSSVRSVSFFYRTILLSTLALSLCLYLRGGAD